MNINRRKIIGFGSIAISSSLAGCTNYFTNPTSNLHVINHDSQSHHIHVSIWELGSNGSQILSEDYELGPDQSNTQDATEKNIMNDNQYAIQTYLLDNESVRNNFVYRPTCTNGCDNTLHVQIQTSKSEQKPYISFDRI